MKTEYPKWLLEMYAVRTTIIPCAHCNELQKYHWGPKKNCKFAPTHYTPEPIEKAWKREQAVRSAYAQNKYG